MGYRHSNRNDIYGVKNRSKIQSFLDAEDAGFRHSHGYHSFFEGWTEVKLKKDNGKYTIKRFYTAPWVVPDGSFGKEIGNRILYFIFFLCAAASFLWALNLPVGSNYCNYVALPGCLSVTGLFLTMVHVFARIFSGKKWTLHTYRVCHDNLGTSAWISAALFAVTEAASVLYNVLHRQEWETKAGLAMAGILVGTACLAGIAFMEKKRNYRQIEHPTKLPDGFAHEIW